MSKQIIISLFIPILLFGDALCDHLFPQEGCSKECPSYYYCDKPQDKCIFKGFFPIYPLEIIEYFIMCSSSALATACGIGGGTIYCAFLLGVQSFEPSKGFPISNFLILCCGCASYITAAQDKYIFPHNSFVNYDLAVIFAPSMLLGTKFGTIWNKTCSSLFLTLCLIVWMCYSMNSTYKNVVKAKIREAKMDEERKQLLLKENESDGESVHPVKTQHSDFSWYVMRQNELEEKKIEKEDNEPIPWDKLRFMLLWEVFVIIDQLWEGNSRVPSVLGIPRCSFLYWCVFVCYIGISAYFISSAFKMIQERYEYKLRVNPKLQSPEITYIQENTIRIVVWTIFAGIMSSMVGIGGGMITNPILWGMGLDPKATSSTSTFWIISTALASTFIYFVSGQLDLIYAICVGVPCTLSAYYGSLQIWKYINRTGKNSIWLTIMLWFLIISQAVILFKAYFDIKESNDWNIFKLKPFC